jgi:hypothetical protein
MQFTLAFLFAGLALAAPQLGGGMPKAGGMGKMPGGMGKMPGAAGSSTPLKILNQTG